MKVVALAGGVGGARLSEGLARVVERGNLSVVVNTGDDFRMHGLFICPDLDTVLYTHAGWVNPEQGWGVKGDTYHALEVLGKLGAPTWFRLGDKDLGLHLQRTVWDQGGMSLTQITERLARAFGVQSHILPMADSAVETMVDTEADGLLSFQEYFVARQHTLKVRALEYRGADRTNPTPEVAAAVKSADLLVFCPSNPFLSIAPILALAGMREKLAHLKCPRIAVSPIIAGKAVKGPAARLMSDFGLHPDVRGLAEYYKGLIDVLVIDEEDQAHLDAIVNTGLKVLVAPIRIQDPEKRKALAERILHYATKEIA